ncbi:MAG: Tad domain-containing protein, partial [Bdellovibrionales bacterium]|nr:Tad domain-containing protein [Bdellovibrionales bacterium]
MAIFIALIFQVLFVLFAMSINLALVVHDKINLQNAVDLAAYYGAQRQAELLNVIAHQNYQIRQSWKLLAWRYQVISTLGLDRPPDPHPARSGFNLTETPFAPGGNSYKPSVCVTFVNNWEIPNNANDNLCHSPIVNIPALPQVPVIAGFIGINVALASLSQQLRAQYNSNCDTHGARNWWWTMMIFNGFRQDQRNRKEVIFKLAENLSKHDFVDLNGSPVSAGVAKTLRKNLTWGNDNDQDSPFQGLSWFNSMEGVDRKSWLPEIQITPTGYYTDVAPGSGCNAAPKHVSQLPARGTAQALLNNDNTLPGATALIPYSQGTPPAESLEHMSLGVEKNPWFNVYFGVKAQTKPRQLFFPFGEPMVFQARAFAKPFGGRIGPWHQISWNPNDSQSSGPKVDYNLPPRAAGFLDSSLDLFRLPNYGRFPGDVLGLRSRQAMAALDDPGNPLRTLKNIKMHHYEINHLINPMLEDPNLSNDPLSWNWMNNTAAGVRDYELAAISPDLFDATYYSIETNFSENYQGRLNNNKLALGIPANVPIRGDLGAHPPVVPSFNVQLQMGPSYSSLKTPRGFYFIKDRFHLLTGWAPQPGQVQYGFPNQFFGQCAIPDDDLQEKMPGSCASGGGRSGYSVKIISRDALYSDRYKIGGGQTALGALRNPPPADF